MHKKSLAMLAMTCLLSASLTTGANPVDNVRLTTANAVDNARLTAARLLGDDSVQAISLKPAYAIYTRPDSTGFAIVGTRGSAAGRVMAFSTTSRWDDTALPPAVDSWLKRLQSTTEEAPSKGQRQDRRQAPTVNSRQSVSPLLTSHWHQGAPYNDLSPIIADGHIKTAAGCVAVAAAQIVYYWRNSNPEVTRYDTPTYSYGGAPVTLVIGKGTPNHWELMRDSYTNVTDSAERAAAAQLCYVIGTTAYLNFASSTGGHINEAATAMRLQYDLLSDYVSRRRYTQDEWESLLYDNVSQGRPVLCSGTGEGGHAFVLDGYHSASGFFHFNFGWGGTADGYYPVDSTENSMGGYRDNQTVVCNIRPLNNPSTAITPTTSLERRTQPLIYDLRGIRHDRITEKGIYILDYGTEKKKIIVR